MAQVVAAGQFVAPVAPGRGARGGGRGADADAVNPGDANANDAAPRAAVAGEPRGNPYLNLPAFCRIAATLKPSSDSEIKIEVWMPLSGWNNKLLAVGNGAWAGSISYNAMAPGLAAGYATTSTDTGHTGGQAATFVDRPEKVIDFAYRAVHEMNVSAKAISAAFYGGGPRLSYFQGCSTGGRQALTAAQRYPLDFDGIIGGATAVNASRLHGTQVWSAQQAHRDDASLIPMNKYAAIHDAALKACDALDGVTDRVIDNPRQCRFDPSILLCKEGDSATCLTAAQVETVKRVYAGPGLFPGYEYGSEGGWNGTLANPVGIANDMYRYLVFNNPNWDYKTLDIEKDVRTLRQGDWRNDEFQRHEFETLLRSRRKAADVPRMGGPWNSCRKQRRVLHQSRQGNRRRIPGLEFHSAVHASRRRALWRGRWSQHIRLAGSSGQVERSGKGA